MVNGTLMPLEILNYVKENLFLLLIFCSTIIFFVSAEINSTAVNKLLS